MSESEGLSAKDEADLYLALAESAQQRFESHHKVEWRILFGLWTFFVAGAAVVTTSDWTATCPVCIALTLIVVVLVGVHWFLWLPDSHKYREECTRSRWWWQGCAWELIPKNQRRIPEELRPEGWRLPSDEKWNEWGKRGFMHPSHWMVGGVTALFALLFLSALCLKAIQ